VAQAGDRTRRAHARPIAGTGPRGNAFIAPTSGATDRLADLAAVQRAIAALPDALRAVFVLREVEGYSHAEIAELLNITTNASEVRLHRAVRSLRRALGGGDQ
jgi:RNA polymerase sigma-70 factor (ECF subfamily)